MRRLTRPTARLFVVAAVAASAAVLLAPAPAARAATITDDAQKAIGYTQAHGMTAGVAVLDTATGRLTTAGRPHREFMAASVVKTLIATRLLLAGRMTGTVAVQAEKMIRRSDNTAAYALYPKAGGARLVPWLARHYGIDDLGGPALDPHRWGTTQLTPAGLARFYAAVRADPRVWPWLGAAMHHYAARTSAGEPNDWGLAAAARGVALKNGWAAHPDARGRLRADINTTGLVQHDRFVVVLLANGPASYYYREGEAVVTHAVRLLLPGGQLVPPPTITSLSVTSGPNAGGTRITVTGSGFTHVAGVRFGTVTATSYGVVSPTRLVVLTPPHAAGGVRLRIDTSHGAAAVTFTYVAPPPSP